MRRAGFIDRNFNSIANEIDRLSEKIVPIDVQKLAMTVLRLCGDSPRQRIEVGSSASNIIRFWPSEIQTVQQSIQVIDDARDRSRRVLAASVIPRSDLPRDYIDDVAVSGVTLQTARSVSTEEASDRALVGMAWDSRRMRQRVAMPLLAAVTYRQEGGSVPAVNSLSTLSRRPELRQNYALRRFGNEQALENINAVYEMDEI